MSTKESMYLNMETITAPSSCLSISPLISPDHYISKINQSKQIQQQYRTKESQVKSSSRNMASSSRDTRHVTNSSGSSSRNRRGSPSSHSGSTTLGNDTAPKRRGRKPTPDVTPEVANSYHSNRHQRQVGLKLGDKYVTEAVKDRDLARNIQKKKRSRTQPSSSAYLEEDEYISKLFS